MLIKKIECEDFRGNKYTEEACFNLTKTELAELELGTKGGLEKELKAIVESEDSPKMLEFFKKLIGKAYGKISDDGRRLMKSEAISEEFFQTNAYDIFFMEIATDADKATEFFKQIVPQDISKQMEGSPIPPMK